MPFDKEAEGNEPLRKIELFFDSGRPQSELDLPMPPMAYIGLGSFATSQDGHPAITNTAFSYQELKAQVDGVKAELDGLLAQAKALFAVSISN
jgi:hypothetical protein